MIVQTLRTVAGLNADLRTMFFTTLLFRAGTMAFPYLSVYLIGQGEYSIAEIGVIVGMFGLGALLADLSASVFLGRIPARVVMVAGPVLYAAVLIVVPMLSGPATVLVGASLVWGFAYEIYTPAVYSRTIERSTPEERKIAFSCNRLAVNVGMGIGPAIGGVVFAIAPVALFHINAACVLAAALFLLARSRRDARNAFAGTPRAVAAPVKTRLVAPTVRGETQFWTIFGLAIPVHIAYALPPILVSAYIIDGLGLPSYWASVVFFVNATVIVLFEVPLNGAMRRMSHSRSLLIGYALAGGGFALMGLSSSPIVLVLATLVWTAGEMIVFPSFLSYVSDLSDPSVSNRNVGLYSAGVNIGFFLAPQISLALTARGDPATPWLVIGASVGVALLLMLGARLSHYTWHREPPAPPASPREEAVPVGTFAGQ